MPRVITGLEKLVMDAKWQNSIKGNIGLLCHSASIGPGLEFAALSLQRVFGDRLKKLFGPQHGILTDVQDNMIESQDFVHPYFKIPVHSLYSHTRSPDEEMLKGIDTLLVDLQDVGTRVYTYITTLGLILETCGELGIEVVVLDRPNPVGGEIVEGNILHHDYRSFVGHYPIPMRHGLTMGEMAKLSHKLGQSRGPLRVIPLSYWDRQSIFDETGLPWAMPSPNLPTSEGTLPYVGTVLFEGTSLSEGRGTTRSLEIFGHPKIEPFSYHEKLRARIKDWGLEGFSLRPLNFLPTFQKYAGIPCGGYQIYVTNPHTFRPWALGQMLCHFFYSELGNEFQWNKKPYEYEFERPAIDMINGGPELRLWVETQGSFDRLIEIEQKGMDDFLSLRDNVLLY